MCTLLGSPPSSMPEWAARTCNRRTIPIPRQDAVWFLIGKRREGPPFCTTAALFGTRCVRAGGAVLRCGGDSAEKNHCPDPNKNEGNVVRGGCKNGPRSHGSGGRFHARQGGAPAAYFRALLRSASDRIRCPSGERSTSRSVARTISWKDLLCRNVSNTLLPPAGSAAA